MCAANSKMLNHCGLRLPPQSRCNLWRQSVAVMRIELSSMGLLLPLQLPCCLSLQANVYPTASKGFYIGQQRRSWSKVSLEMFRPTTSQQLLHIPPWKPSHAAEVRMQKCRLISLSAGKATGSPSSVLSEAAGRHTGLAGHGTHQASKHRNWQAGSVRPHSAGPEAGSYQTNKSCIEPLQQRRSQQRGGGVQ